MKILLIIPAILALFIFNSAYADDEYLPCYLGKDATLDLIGQLDDQKEFIFSLGDSPTKKQENNHRRWMQKLQKEAGDRDAPRACNLEETKRVWDLEISHLCTVGILTNSFCTKYQIQNIPISAKTLKNAGKRGGFKFSCIPNRKWHREYFVSQMKSNSMDIFDHKRVTEDIKGYGKCSDTDLMLASIKLDSHLIQNSMLVERYQNYYEIYFPSKPIETPEQVAIEGTDKVSVIANNFIKTLREEDSNVLVFFGDSYQRYVPPGSNIPEDNETDREIDLVIRDFADSPDLPSTYVLSRINKRSDSFYEEEDPVTPIVTEDASMEYPDSATPSHLNVTTVTAGGEVENIELSLDTDTSSSELSDVPSNTKGDAQEDEEAQEEEPVQEEDQLESEVRVSDNIKPVVGDMTEVIIEIYNNEKLQDMITVNMFVSKGGGQLAHTIEILQSTLSHKVSKDMINGNKCAVYEAYTGTLDYESINNRLIRDAIQTRCS